MNRQERRLHAKTHRAKYTDRLEMVPRKDWPEPKPGQPYPSQLWVSREYSVQKYHEANGVVRLSINRCQVNGHQRWADGLSWDELQRIKNEVGYADHDAVEVYPRNSDVINDANMRHLWVLPYRLPFAWRNKRV